MSEKIPEIFLNTMFEYDGFGCHCVKDTENVAPNEPPQTTLKLYTDISKPLRFASKGLQECCGSSFTRDKVWALARE